MQLTDTVGERPGWGEPSAKTITWHDPMVALHEAARRELSGLEFFQALLAGELSPPPITNLFDVRLLSVESGAVVFGCTPDHSVLNPMGGVHGGVACTLLDSALGCAAHSTLPPATGHTSIEIKTSFLRPLVPGEAVEARGRVTKAGRRVIFTEGEIVDGEGRVLATATSTLLVMPAAG